MSWRKCLHLAGISAQKRGGSSFLLSSGKGKLSFCWMQSSALHVLAEGTEENVLQYIETDESEKVN